MPLRLVSSDTASQQLYLHSIENNGGSGHSGGGSTLHRSEPDRLPIMFGLLWTADFEIVFAASSFYPGCGGDKPEHAVSYASPVSSVSSGSDNNGRDTETGSDHANEQEMVELAQKQPSRFCATVALEVCSQCFSLARTYNKCCSGHLAESWKAILVYLPL
jgi:hypothetical protein